MRDAWEHGRALGMLSLRRKQSEMAQEGNVTMLIWLGKQLLGQKDSTSIEHSGQVDSVNYHIDLRAAIMQALAAHPDARQAVAQRLLELDAEQVDDEGEIANEVRALLPPANGNGSNGHA